MNRNITAFDYLSVCCLEYVSLPLSVAGGIIGGLGVELLGESEAKDEWRSLRGWYSAEARGTAFPFGR